jgi:hypothetical protein
VARLIKAAERAGQRVTGISVSPTGTLSITVQAVSEAPEKAVEPSVNWLDAPFDID